MFGSEGHISARFTKGNTVDVCQTAEMWPFWIEARAPPHHFSPPPSLPGEIMSRVDSLRRSKILVSVSCAGHGARKILRQLDLEA